jgi:hypothetical protein
MWIAMLNIPNLECIPGKFLFHNSPWHQARRDSSAVTRPTSGVISQAGDPSNIEEDKNEIQDYVKEVFFEKVVFIWNKGALQPGGVLHKDYLMNCRAKIAARKQADECYRQ